MDTITYSDARADLAKTLDRVRDDRGLADQNMQLFQTPV